MKYKQFSKQEILKREEYYCNEKAQKLYEFLKSKNDEIDCYYNPENDE